MPTPWTISATPGRFIPSGSAGIGLRATSVRADRQKRFTTAQAPFPSSQRSIQSCPAGQLHNSKEVGRTKTKDLSSYFLERGGAQRRGGQLGEALLPVFY